MNVLLTGATGFIGSHVLERVLARGDRVRVLALPETVEDVRHRDQVEIVVGDLTEEAVLEEAVRGVEVVYHLAALLPGSAPAELRAVNVGGTENLLRACGRTGGVRRFVFTSSVCVYRPAPWPSLWPIGEDWPRRAHGNAQLRDYGQSMIDAEDLIVGFHREHGLEYSILRATLTYGPGAEFVEQLLWQVVNRPRLALVRGAQLGAMQWVHASDLARAIVLAGNQPAAATEMFNVAGTEVTTMQEVATVLHELLRLGTYWPRNRHVLKFDIRKAAVELGYEPQVSLREGLGELLTTMDPVWLFSPHDSKRLQLQHGRDHSLAVQGANWGRPWMWPDPVRN